MKTVLFMTSFDGVIAPTVLTALLRYVGKTGSLAFVYDIEKAQRFVANCRPGEVLIDYNFFELRGGEGDVHGGVSAYLALREVIGETPARVMAESWTGREEVTHSFHLQGIPYGQYNELTPG